MGFKDVLLNVVTVGGHARVQSAICNYETHYAVYQGHYQQAKALETALAHTVTQLGVCTGQAVRLLTLSQKLLLRQPNTPQRLHAPGAFAPISVQKTHHLLAHYSSAMAASQGAGLGAATAAGSWALVSLLGTASTGTAIGTLSGAAATNATLAWLGGGALAAGGGGMAAGLLTLGGLVALPLIAFSAWSTHSKADDIQKQTVGLQHANDQLVQLLPVLTQRQDMAQQQHQRLSQALQQLNAVYQRIRAQLLPIWLLSHLWRLLRMWFGWGYYRPDEQGAVQELDQAAQDFVALFAPDHPQAPATSSTAAPPRIAPSSRVADPKTNPEKNRPSAPTPCTTDAVQRQPLPPPPNEILIAWMDPKHPQASPPSSPRRGVQLTKSPP